MRVHLSLGSNVGDRKSNLRAAVHALATMERVTLKAISQCYESEPIGFVEQSAFLNLAAEIETDIEPLELLSAVKELEHRLGRTPTHRWGPRIIDIDLILCDERRMKSEMLTLPHPEFRRRAFVLAPLAEIAPEAMDPVTGMTVAVLAGQPAAHGEVRPAGPLND